MPGLGCSPPPAASADTCKAFLSRLQNARVPFRAITSSRHGFNARLEVWNEDVGRVNVACDPEGNPLLSAEDIASAMEGASTSYQAIQRLQNFLTALQAQIEPAKVPSPTLAH